MAKITKRHRRMRPASPVLDRVMRKPRVHGEPPPLYRPSPPLKPQPPNPPSHPGMIIARHFAETATTRSIRPIELGTDHLEDSPTCIATTLRTGSDGDRSSLMGLIRCQRKCRRLRVTVQRKTTNASIRRLTTADH
jgi:hypothetical protein